MSIVRKHMFKVSILQGASIAVFLLVWNELIAFKILNPYLFATPFQIAENFSKVVERPGVLGTIELGMLITLVTYAVSLLVGLGLGLVLGSSTYIKRVFEIHLVLFNSIPKTVFLPVFLLAFGIGSRFEFLFAFMSAVVPMTLNIMFSVATVPESLVRVARSMGASTSRIYIRVIIPSVVPTILATARIVFGATFAGVLIAQQFAGNVGFGYLIAKYSALFEVVPLYVIVVTASFVGIATYLILLGVEKRLIKWSNI